MWRRVYALMIKEFLALLKDKRSRVVVIVPPIIQLLVFGYAATFDLNRVPFAVYNEDAGPASRDLVARFTGSAVFHQVAAPASDAEVAPLVDSQRVLMVLHIGPQFSRELASGRAGTVQVIVDGRNSNTAAILLGYVSTIAADFSADWLAKSGAAPPAQLEVRAWFNPNLESRWFLVPGILGLLTLLVALLVTALSIAREREQGTFDQLLVTPYRPAEVLLGKTLPGLVIGFGEATVIVILATLWFQVPLRGELVTLYAGLFVFLFSALSVGLMISSFAVTQQQGLLGVFLFMVPSMMLSGFATPIANMPVWMQYLTLVNPMRYFLVIIRGVFLQGAPFGLLFSQFWPMAVIGLVNMAVAGFLFRRRLY
jgi:ABC-2 type transport system permease protein